MTAATLDWDAEPTDDAAPVVDAFDAQLVAWFGDDRSSWPADAANELASWTLAFPAPDGQTRMACPADMPVIRAALTAGIRWGTLDTSTAADPLRTILAHTLHADAATGWELFWNAVTTSGADLAIRFASHPGTPPIVLATLADDAYTDRWTISDRWTIRELVAKHLNTPPATLARLAAEPLGSDPGRGAYVMMLQKVARNPATPVESLYQMLGKHGAIDNAVLSNPLMDTHLLQRFNAGDRREHAVNAASRHATDPLVLDSIAEEHFRSAHHVASSPATHKATLSRLARMPDSKVQQAVAVHPSTTPRTLRRLARSADEDARLGVFWHPAASNRTIRRLAAHHQALADALPSRKAWADSGFDNDVRRRFEALARDTAPIDVLLQRAADPDHRVQDSAIWSLLDRRSHGE